jgi:hypothetical protein
MDGIIDPGIPEMVGAITIAAVTGIIIGGGQPGIGMEEAVRGKVQLNHTVIVNTTHNNNNNNLKVEEDGFLDGD